MLCPGLNFVKVWCSQHDWGGFGERTAPNFYPCFWQHIGQSGGLTIIRTEVQDQTNFQLRHPPSILSLFPFEEILSLFTFEEIFRRNSEEIQKKFRRNSEEIQKKYLYCHYSHLKRCLLLSVAVFPLTGGGTPGHPVAVKRQTNPGQNHIRPGIILLSQVLFYKARYYFIKPFIIY